MSRERIHLLLEQSASLGDQYLPKIPLLEEAVKLADAAQDSELGYLCRNELVEAATFAGHSEKSLVAFSWCLAKLDANAIDTSPFDLMWKYKWVLSGSLGFPNIPRQQIESMHDDFERRCGDLGYSVRSAHYMKWRQFLRLGEMDAAEQEYRKWQRSNRDSLADCPACERNTEVWYSKRLGEDRRAIDLAEPIVAGRLFCSAVPQATYAILLEPACRTGDLALAQKFHLRGYRKVRGNRKDIGKIAMHILYLCFRDKLDRAVRVFSENIGVAAEATNRSSVLEFYAATAILFRRLAEVRKRRMKLILPPTLGCQVDDDRYAAQALAEWFDDQTQQLVKAFNQRNGNSYAGDRYQQMQDFGRAT